MKIEEGEGRDEEEFDLSLNYGSSVLDVGEAAPLGQRTCLEIHDLASVSYTHLTLPTKA